MRCHGVKRTTSDGKYAIYFNARIQPRGRCGVVATGQHEADEVRLIPYYGPPHGRHPVPRPLEKCLRNKLTSRGPSDTGALRLCERDQRQPVMRRLFTNVHLARGRDGNDKFIPKSFKSS
jgi:hypothetical protein